MNLTEMFLDSLESADISPELANAAIVLQCFSLDAIVEFAAVQRQRGYDIPLVWLVECEHGLPGEDELQRLQGLATYVGVGCVDRRLRTASCLVPCRGVHIDLSTALPVCIIG